MTPHTIPVGGSEPMHICSTSCWCHPLPSDGIVIHNAKDCREARERHGQANPDQKWTIVGQPE